MSKSCHVRAENIKQNFVSDNDDCSCCDTNSGPFSQLATVPHTLHYIRCFGKVIILTEFFFGDINLNQYGTL